MRSALCLVAVALIIGGNPIGEGRAMADVKPARDGDVAIAEELEAARSAGTIAAYDLFIARHPRHPLAEIARQERSRIVAAKDCPDGTIER